MCVKEEGSSRLRKHREKQHTALVQCLVSERLCVCACVCVCFGWFYSLGSIAAWNGSGCIRTTLNLLPLSFLTTPPTLPPFLPNTEGAPAVPMMKEEGLLSRRRFSTCGGTASLRPPHPDGRKLIRNASFGGYNELSPISLPGWCLRVWSVL